MDEYDGFPRESQCDQLQSYFGSARKQQCKNESFATFPACRNGAQTPDLQGVAPTYGDEGLVYGSSHATLTTYTLQLPFITGWHARQPKGTQRYIAHKRKLADATHRTTKAWCRLSTDDRDRLTCDFAFRSESLAWTLNLTPKQAARLRKSDRPAKMLADAINRAAKRELGYTPPISLALEVTPGGRLHAHGIVTLGGRQGAAFCRALKSAGGKVHGCGAGRQTDIRRLWSAAGWAAYIAKAFDQTAAALGTDKIIYQCRATVAGARAEYEASLHRQKARKKTQGRPVGAKKAPASLSPLPAPEARQRPAMSQNDDRVPVNQYLLTNHLKNNDKTTLTQDSEWPINRAAMNTLLEHTNHMTHIVLDALTYSRLMDAFLVVALDAGAAQDADAFKIALGEIAGIWPESVLSSYGRRERFLEAA